jgi:dTDP-4-amino-4,6-dideoxygalactose transaminase
MISTTRLAIRGGEKTVKKSFPWPTFDQDDVRAVAEVVRSGQWGDPDCTGMTAKFERQFADYCGAPFAVASVNGSVAIRLALIASGAKPGDEVIIPPYTFISTASVVLEANCVPVFVDILPETYNIDPVRIEEAATERTRAIIPVHFGGQACDMDRIMAIARRRSLTVIEDACHAHGAEYKGRKLGSIGHAGCFSFQLSKNLTSGEGGVTITSDRKLFETMDSLRNVGRIQGGQWYEHHNLGCNYRMTAFQAALLITQLRRLGEQTRRRDANGRYLAELLREIDGISPLTRGHGETLHSYHLFVFRYDQSKFNNLPKADFAKWLAAEGVPAFMGYPRPLYKQPLFLEKRFFCYAIPPEVDYSGVHCPVAERACAEEAVWIMQPALLGDRADMESFAQAIRKIQRYCLSK